MSYGEAALFQGFLLLSGDLDNCLDALSRAYKTGIIQDALNTTVIIQQ